MEHDKGKIKTLKNNLVLLAEDHRNNQYVLSKMLEPAGVRSVTASNGMEAVEVIKSNKSVSVSLLDLKMPLMDGYQAMKEIRKIRPDIVIIAQTAYALQGDREKIIEAGFDDYLAKPITLDDLKSVINKYLPGE
ncbi:MAG TPA: response regulator [Bacteroidales bacterium]|nr:response regulator [Bacteroidales bacterium]